MYVPPHCLIRVINWIFLTSNEIIHGTSHMQCKTFFIIWEYVSITMGINPLFKQYFKCIFNVVSSDCKLYPSCNLLGSAYINLPSLTLIGKNLWTWFRIPFCGSIWVTHQVSYMGTFQVDYLTINSMNINFKELN